MIDLHMHSLYSNDGEFTPEKLVNKCAAQGVSLMSITDHNCVKANREALSSARQFNIAYIPGVEIDCSYEGNNFHMLGYDINYLSPDFDSVETFIRSQGMHSSLAALEKTRALGFSVTEDDMKIVSRNSYWPETWTGEMFAEVLLSNPEYAEHPLLKPYRFGGNRSDNPYVNFYWDFYSQGKPCYSEIVYPKMQEIIDLIHQNHGLAVLAHPGVNLKQKEYLLDGIIRLGIDGIEAYSSYHTPAQNQNYRAAAEKYSLFVTCGSDFHGKTKPAIELAQHGSQITERELSAPLKNCQCI